MMYPITGTLKFWVSNDETDATALIEKETGDGITVHYADGGFISIEVGAADLVGASITTDTELKCSLWENDGSGNKKFLAEGDYTVKHSLEDF